jgi:hypothetical protein
MPLSANVIFQREVRLELQKQGSRLNGVEIFQLAGRRWSALPPEDKRVRMEETRKAREQYKADINEYRMTPQYAEYQKYLAEFQRDQACATSGMSAI